MSSDLFSVHGEKIEIKNEPFESEEVFQEPQASKKVVDTCLKCEICSALFKTKRNLKRHVESVHEGKNLPNAIFVILVLLRKLT